VARPNSKRSKVIRAGLKWSRPTSMKTNEDPHVSAVPARNAQSFNANAPTPIGVVIGASTRADMVPP
jgi:hypothetical protein